jgi:hypothetical protein
MSNGLGAYGTGNIELLSSATGGPDGGQIANCTRRMRDDALSAFHVCESATPPMLPVSNAEISG